MPLDPASLFDMTHAATFLGGTAVGAAGKYVADRFTDHRHAKEARLAEQRRFSKLTKTMPALIIELRDDLTKNKGLHLREFVVLPNPGVTFVHDRPRIQLFETSLPAAQNQVATLLSEGHIEVARDGQCPIYRLKESFVAHLTSDA